LRKDLGGHHHDRSLPVRAQITGHQADLIGTELLAEIAQFLVGEGLQRRGVEHLLAVGQGPVDGVFAHKGFAGPRGSADHHRMPLVEGIDRLVLKGIERKRKELLKGRHLSPRESPGARGAGESRPASGRGASEPTVSMNKLYGQRADWADCKALPDARFWPLAAWLSTPSLP